MERSASAGSNRGEMLGMIAKNVFLLAVEEFYKEGGGKNRVACYNKGALFMFAKTAYEYQRRQVTQTFKGSSGR